MELLRRPAILPVLLFILVFKLPDAAMGFMVKPFWVDVGFSAAQIGLVSVNIGLALSIAGGIVGGWITDRIGIFSGLWMLGLAQAVSNLGYWLAASVIPLAAPGASVPFEHMAILYAASATESFTGGLGTAAFLAFLMAIVEKERAATEYALLSSVFALSRSVAGWVGGLGAQSMGYGNWFLLTFFLAAPAYLLLPWVRRMLTRGDTMPLPETSGTRGSNAGRGFAMNPLKFSSIAHRDHDYCNPISTAKIEQVLDLLPLDGRRRACSTSVAVAPSSRCGSSNASARRSIAVDHSELMLDAARERAQWTGALHEAAPRRHRHPELRGGPGNLPSVGDARCGRHRRRYGRDLQPAQGLDQGRRLHPDRRRLLAEEAPPGLSSNFSAEAKTNTSITAATFRRASTPGSSRCTR